MQSSAFSSTTRTIVLSESDNNGVFTFSPADFIVQRGSSRRVLTSVSLAISGYLSRGNTGSLNALFPALVEISVSGTGSSQPYQLFLLPPSAAGNASSSESTTAGYILNISSNSRGEVSFPDSVELRLVDGSYTRSKQQRILGELTRVSASQAPRSASASLNLVEIPVAFGKTLNTVTPIWNQFNGLGVDASSFLSSYFYRNFDDGSKLLTDSSAISIFFTVDTFGNPNVSVNAIFVGSTSASLSGNSSSWVGDILSNKGNAFALFFETAPSAILETRWVVGGLIDPADADYPVGVIGVSPLPKHLSAVHLTLVNNDGLTNAGLFGPANSWTGKCTRAWLAPIHTAERSSACVSISLSYEAYSN